MTLLSCNGFHIDCLLRSFQSIHNTSKQILLQLKRQWRYLETLVYFNKISQHFHNQMALIFSDFRSIITYNIIQKYFGWIWVFLIKTIKKLYFSGYIALYVVKKAFASYKCNVVVKF